MGQFHLYILYILYIIHIILVLAERIRRFSGWKMSFPLLRHSGLGRPSLQGAFNRGLNLG